MPLIVYDGNFDGFLSAVFDIYEYRHTDVSFTSQDHYQQPVFGEVHFVHTDQQKSSRVWKGLEQRISRHAMVQLYKTFLSEKKDIEKILLNYIQYAFSGKLMMEHDFSHPSVLTVAQISRIVHREKHRMEAFIRFQLTQDGLYYAVVEPDFNVLPLICKHFRDRYADQSWMIYDIRRKYGLYYDKQKVETVSMSFDPQAGSARDIKEIYDEKEELYQKLWQQYFKSVNIAARKNMKLHIRHMPKRYWSYLTEKLSFDE